MLAVIGVLALSALDLWLSTAKADPLRGLTPVWLTLGLAGLLGAYLLSRNLRWGIWLSITVAVGSVVLLAVVAAMVATSFEELGDRSPPPTSSP